MTDHQSKKQKTTHVPPADIASRPLPIQRRRVWRACESCRRKKIKCDGHEPVCSQCTQTNSACTWIQTKDRAALSRHYVQELEARLIQMEGLLTQVGGPTELLTPDTTRRRGTVNASTSASSIVSPAPVSSSRDHAAYLTDPSVRQAPSDPDQFGQLAVDANGHLRWIGGSSAMTLVDAFKNISTAAASSGSTPPRADADHCEFLGNQGKHPVANIYFPPNLRPNTRPRALPGPEEVEFPPRDLADKLVAAYFTHFHHTLPVVDSTAFLSQYRSLMDNRRISSPAEAGFPTVVFSVFACAARYVDDARLENPEPDAHEAGMAHVYYERAMILYYTGHTATQLAHVQAFVLLSSYLASINSLPQSWLLCGQAVRIAQDLGLHRSPRHLSLTPIDKETRRKVWWCVYGLDRMLAVALGRPLGIDDADCDIELPLDIDDVALPAYFAGQNASLVGSTTTTIINGESTKPYVPASPSLMKGFNALTCLFKIAGQVLRQVYAIDKSKENLDPEKMAELQSSVDRLDRLLTEWCDKLPAPFKSNPQTSQQVSMGAILCSCYYAVTVTLHRNFIPTSLVSNSIPRSSSVPKAVTASRSCIFLAQSIKDVIPSSHWLAFFSQYLFSSAIIILLCVMRATDQEAVNTAMNEVAAAIECLGTLEASWPGARKCKEILKELADITLSKVRDTLAVPSPTKRDRLTIAAENILAGSQSPLSKAFITTPNVSLANQSPTGAHTRPIESRLDARTPALSCKRILDEMDGSGSNVTGFGFSSSPGLSAFSGHHKPHQPVTSDPLGHNESLSNGISSDISVPNPYSFGELPVSPASQRWSTPRSSGATLCGSDAMTPVDYLALHNGSDGLESATQPHPFNTSTPTPKIRQHFDSAYLPPFAFPIFDGSMSNSPPSPGHFDLSDLPFSGLDFLQSFSSTQDGVTGTNEGDPLDPLWTQLGASPFKMGPELPFALIEGQVLS